MDENSAQGNERQGLTRAQVVGFVLGPLFLVMTLLLPPPAQMPVEAWRAAGLMLLMATWWST